MFVFGESLRVVDLRCVCARRAGDARAATANYARDRNRNEFCPHHRRRFGRGELDLSPRREPESLSSTLSVER